MAEVAEVPMPLAVPVFTISSFKGQEMTLTQFLDWMTSNYMEKLAFAPRCQNPCQVGRRERQQQCSTAQAMMGSAPPAGARSAVPDPTQLPLGEVGRNTE